MPINLFYTIEDGNGDQSVVNLPIEELDVAAGVNFPFILETAWDIINPLVNGHLVNCGVTIQADISEFTNAAVAAIADVQEKAEFVFRAAGGFLKRISLPTFIETFFTGSGAGNEIDVTQTAVQNFITMIEDGVDDALVDPTPVQFVTDHSEDVESYVKGRQSWGRNRR